MSPEEKLVQGGSILWANGVRAGRDQDGNNVIVLMELEGGFSAVTPLTAEAAVLFAQDLIQFADEILVEGTDFEAGDTS